MTVAELIDQLKLEDPARIVVLSSDGEGNRYSPLADVLQTGAYKSYSDWQGACGLEKLTPELRKAGFGKADVIKGGMPCLILYPER